MKISKILDNIWISILTILGIIFYIFMLSAIIGIFVKEGVNNETISGNSILMAIVLLSFSYLLAVYIGRTKKDIEILEIMEQQHEREEDYLRKLAFVRGLGPMGPLMEYGDHASFFIFPHIQRRRLYKDIDVKKIPFKKKFPFILFLVSFLLVPIFGFLAYLYAPSVEEEFVSDERRYRNMMLKIKQEHREYNKCIDNNELCLCLLKNGDAVTCRDNDGSIYKNSSGTTLFEYTEKRLESVGINVEDIIGHKKTSYKTSYGKIKLIEMSEEEASLYK